MQVMGQKYIRNFCIIAHIDHGKSTLADRLLEMTGTVEKRQMQEQLLDSNPIERERGITIKLAPVRMIYEASNSKHQILNKSKIQNTKVQNSLGFRNLDLEFANSKQPFVLNLIDTPGHVDFNYEVSRSLAACEGAVLVVDATQGVQAQTLANLNLARKQRLAIIPVINKIDLPNAQITRSIEELRSLAFREEEILQISAKTGKNVDLLLQAIVERIPEPKGVPNGTLRALVFSSQYDSHKGVVVYVRVVDGEVRRQSSAVSFQTLKFMASGMEITPIEVGYFIPHMRLGQSLLTGEVGYIATGLKDVILAKVGDTITAVSLQPSANRRSDSSNLTADSSVMPLPGYKEPKPMVFLGLFPIQSDEINEVRDALGKLRLSDSAFTFRPIASAALGHGFHCGFLGLLHAEVVQERLTREFGLNLLATAPTVEYKIKLAHSHQPSANRLSESRKLSAESLVTIQSATEFPDPSVIDQSFEPVMEVTIFSPKKYVGAIMQLCQDKRGEYIDLEYFGHSHETGSSDDPVSSERTLARFTYLVPLSEMIVDFFDALKSATEGYASLDYEFFDYQSADVVKLDILLNHEKVDAFSQLVVSDRAQSVGRRLVEKLAEVIPRQNFAIPIQATIGGKIISRADVKPFRKDVTQKLYGGDRTRKDKLLEAQKKGKARMKLVGRVEIPQSAFLQVFKRG